jgi:3-mercaptopyruvate sulfurtransferase SseA
MRTSLKDWLERLVQASNGKPRHVHCGKGNAAGANVMALRQLAIPRNAEETQKHRV